MIALVAGESSGEPSGELEVALAAFGVRDDWESLPDAERSRACEWMAQSDTARRARLVAQMLSAGRSLDRRHLDRMWRSWQADKVWLRGSEPAPSDEPDSVPREPPPFSVMCETGWDPPRRRNPVWRWFWTVVDLWSVADEGVIPDLGTTPRVGEPRWRVVLIDRAGYRVTESEWRRNWGEVESLQAIWRARASTSKVSDVYETAHTWPGSCTPPTLVTPRPSPRR